jgi:hypothetical protein
MKLLFQILLLLLVWFTNLANAKVVFTKLVLSSSALVGMKGRPRAQATNNRYGEQNIK